MNTLKEENLDIDAAVSGYLDNSSLAKSLMKARGETRIVSIRRRGTRPIIKHDDSNIRFSRSLQIREPCLSVRVCRDMNNTNV